MENAFEPSTPVDFPREISPGIFWLGQCVSVGRGLHMHLGVFLLRGASRTLLVDTGITPRWTEVRGQIDAILDCRPLDYVFPTHPEPPHSAALTQVLETYPEAEVVGDMRDYHLYFPEHADRLRFRGPGDTIDLGDLLFTFIEAPMKDLPNTLWGYESRSEVMFVSDGFAYAHGGRPDDDGAALHAPGECALLNSEIPSGVSEGSAQWILNTAMHWTKFVSPHVFFADLEGLLKRYPTRLIAPAHGNVVDEIGSVMSTIRAVHDHAYDSTALLAAGAD